MTRDGADRPARPGRSFTLVDETTAAPHDTVPAALPFRPAGAEAPQMPAAAGSSIPVYTGSGQTEELVPSGAPAEGTAPSWLASPSRPPAPAISPVPGSASPSAAHLRPPEVPSASPLVVEPAPPAMVGPVNPSVPATVPPAVVAPMNIPSYALAAPLVSGPPHVRPPDAETAWAAGDRGATYLELLWHDPDVVPRLRAREDFARWVKPRPKAPPPSPGKAPKPPAPGAIEKAELQDVHAVLSTAPPAAAIDVGILSERADDPEPPLVLAAGTLSFAFDAVLVLEAAATLAKPLGAADRKLKEVLDQVAELLGSGADVSEDAPGWTARIREACSRLNKSSSSTLDARVEQKLVEQRKYRRKSVLGGDRIRALLAVPGGEPLVVYLPVEMSARLPLFARFEVRMLADLYPQQDAAETSPLALKVAAIGRALSHAKPGR